LLDCHDLDSDSDNEEYDSDDSNATVEQKEIKFVDIATRSSAVQSQIHPKVMLQDVPVSWRATDSLTARQATLLSKAVMDHDLDAFKHIGDLYNALPQPLEIGKDIFNVILDHDQPDILDEYIRRTGAGINVAQVNKEGEGSAIPAIVNDQNKIYLGLNVHGKKRMDLAKKNDPDAAVTNTSQEEIPLVWDAIRKKSAGILKYLSTNQPPAAYKYYSISNSSAKAIWLRRLLSANQSLPSTAVDPEQKISEWLGWTINSLGESPLFAGILSHDLNTIKLLAKLKPALFAESLQTKYVSLQYSRCLCSHHPAGSNSSALTPFSSQYAFRPRPISSNTYYRGNFPQLIGIPTKGVHYDLLVSGI